MVDVKTNLEFVSSAGRLESLCKSKVKGLVILQLNPTIIKVLYALITADDYIGENRRLYTQDVRTMESRILIEGWKENQTPIQISFNQDQNKYTVVDGQHRIAALRNIYEQGRWNGEYPRQLVVFGASRDELNATHDCLAYSLQSRASLKDPRHSSVAYKLLAASGILVADLCGGTKSRITNIGVDRFYDYFMVPLKTAIEERMGSVHLTYTSTGNKSMRFSAEYFAALCLYSILYGVNLASRIHELFCTADEREGIIAFWRSVMSEGQFKQRLAALKKAQEWDEMSLSHIELAWHLRVINQFHDRLKSGSRIKAKSMRKTNVDNKLFSQSIIPLNVAQALYTRLNQLNILPYAPNEYAYISRLAARNLRYISTEDWNEYCKI